MEPKKQPLKRVPPRSNKSPDLRAELVIECKDGAKTAYLNSAMVEILEHGFIDWPRLLQSINIRIVVDGKEWANDEQPDTEHA